MSRGGFIQGDTRYAGKAGRWGVADTVDHPNLGIGVEEFFVGIQSPGVVMYTAPDFKRRNFDFDPLYVNVDERAKPVFFPSGMMAIPLAVSYGDGAVPGVRLWNPTNWKWETSAATVGMREANRSISMMALDNTGTQLATTMQGTSSYLYIHDVGTTRWNTPAQIKPLYQTSCMAWSPVDNRLAIGALSQPYFAIYGNGAFDTNINIQKTVYAIAWSPNGNYLAVGGLGWLKVCGVSGRQLTSYADINVKGTTVKDVSWSPDGEFLAFAADGKLASGPFGLYKPSNLTTTYLPYPITSAGGYTATFSPSGKWIACSVLTGGMHIYSFANGTASYKGPVKTYADRNYCTKVAWWNQKLQKASS